MAKLYAVSVMSENFTSFLLSKSEASGLTRVAHHLRVTEADSEVKAVGMLMEDVQKELPTQEGWKHLGKALEIFQDLIDEHSTAGKAGVSDETIAHLQATGQLTGPELSV